MHRYGGRTTSEDRTTPQLTHPVGDLIAVGSHELDVLREPRAVADRLDHADGGPEELVDGRATSTDKHSVRQHRPNAIVQRHAAVGTDAIAPQPRQLCQFSRYVVHMSRV